jgi:ankyrin repeat protein
MGESTAADRVATWLNALAAGDGKMVIDGLAEEAVFTTSGVESQLIVPYFGTWRGKAAIVNALAVRSGLVETIDSELRDSTVVPGGGCALIETRERHRQSGGVFATAAVHHVRLDGRNRIAYWRSVFDPGAEIAAFRTGRDEALLQALWSGDGDAARAHLRGGADANARDRASGLTALHIACGRAQPDFVRLLLDAGADPYVVDTVAGASPLHTACQGGSAEIVRMLLGVGAFVDCVAPTTGHTPLFDALWFKFPEVVRELLDAGASLNLSTHYGFSLAEHISFETAANLIGRDAFAKAAALVAKRRASDEAQKAGQFLMAAVVAKDAIAVRAHIKAHADLAARFPRVNGFNDGHTPLHVACRDGTPEIVADLVAAGAPVNTIEPCFMATPLHKAVYNGHVDITRLLVAVPGIDLDVQGGTNGYTALHDAIWHGFETCTEILLAAGARVDLRGHDGKTPLDVALDSFGSDHRITALIRARLAPPETVPASTIPNPAGR